MLRFGNKKKENFMMKKILVIWDLNLDPIVISNWIETKNSSNYLIGCLDEVMGAYFFWHYLKWVDTLKHLKRKMIN